MAATSARGEVRERTVGFTSEGVRLDGLLGVPRGACGVVAFAHGSGSGRFSPRNGAVAELLRKAGMATFLVDLLDEAESRDRACVFDVARLARRLRAVSDWLADDPATRDLPLGYFGASTGAGAALLAAAHDGNRVKAVVSRGGRPDLALDALPAVTAPTLLIVGGRDTTVLELNRRALEQLTGPKRLEVIPGATHLFPEPGALEEVARLATLWFAKYLPQEGTCPTGPLASPGGPRF